VDLVRHVLIAGSLVLWVTTMYSEAPEPIPINPGKPIAVCEVLNNLASYRGKIIEVRGEWTGTVGGTCNPIRTGAHTWFNAILVILPNSGFGEGTDPRWQSMDSSLYEAALHGAHGEWNRLPARTKARAKVMATIVGLLEARDPPLQMAPSGLPLGYGHLNAYPAQIIVYTVKDIALEADGKVVYPPRTAIPFEQ
jgi:hypothetical protein